MSAACCALCAGGKARCRARQLARACESRACVFGFDLAKDPFDVGFDEGPCALVFRFFLTPDNFCVFEAFKFLEPQIALGRDRIVQRA